LGAVTLYGLGLTGGRAGRRFIHAGLLVHGIFIVKRAALLGRLPITERLDILSAISFLLIVSLLISKRKQALPVPALERYLLPLSSVFALSAVFYEPINTISQNMQTPWFYMHTGFNILSFVLLGTGASMEALYLKSGEEPLYESRHRLTLWGWTALSLSLISGSIWFFLAYGSYWQWTATELWGSLVWFYYGIYLHSGQVKGLRGWPSAAIGSFGYLLLLFSYFGVGALIPSPWTQF